MYITQANMINYKLMADKALIDSAQIDDLIETDKISPIKLAMSQGVNYYKGKHDYLTHKNTYFVDGNEIEDKIKANNKIVHLFHKILVNQKAAYIAGNPIVVSLTVEDVKDENNPTPQEDKAISESKEFQTVLLEELGEKFNDMITDLLTGSSNKGLEWLHFYINKEGELNYVITPAEQIIAIYDTQYQDKLLYVIRYYSYDIIDPVGKTMATKYKVEWWTDKNVTYWEQQIDGTYIHDPNYYAADTTVYLLPHWTAYNTKSPSAKQGHSWGRVPFICLPNNSDYSTDLSGIKALIDSYDKVKSGWCNDLEDFQELLYNVKGYNGLSAEARQGYTEIGFLVHNLKTNKVVLTDNDGDVTTIKAEIPIEAKTKFLDITRREIFYFGEGVDINDEKIANSPSGVSLMILYEPLNEKCNRMITKLKLFLRNFMQYVTEYINMRDGTDYDYKQIVYTINKSTIFNEIEKVNALNASGAQLSQQTLLEQHPWVNDVDEEIARLEKEKNRRDEQGLVDLEKVSDSETMLDNEGNPIKDINVE
jgi:SPP1 family phage portal protein